MNELSVTVSLDDAFDCYEMSKRQVSETPLFCYDIEKSEFVKVKNSMSSTCFLFLNAYSLCSNLIDSYLQQPGMERYRELFYEENKGAKNKIVAFLWFFEHIDGCMDFEKYEMAHVTKELKKWCKENKFLYTEPEVYKIN